MTGQQLFEIRRLNFKKIFINDQKNTNSHTPKKSEMTPTEKNSDLLDTLPNGKSISTIQITLLDRLPWKKGYPHKSHNQIRDENSPT